MPLPADTIRSLKRLNTFQEAFEKQEIPRWKRLFLKTDSLFLMMLFIGLFSFSAFALLLVNKSLKESAVKKQQQATFQKNWDVLEIPLGEFESMKNSREKPGYFSVVEYEATLSVEGSTLGFMQQEREIYSRKTRLRSIIEAVVNRATSQELNEPNLNSIRTTILKQVNEVLGDDKVSDVLFPHFAAFDLPGSL